MDSNIYHNNNHNQQHHHHQQQNMNSGFTRYRSAPSSYFANLINSGMYGEEDLDHFISTHQNTNHIVGNQFMVSQEQQQQNLYRNHAPSHSHDVVHNNNMVVSGSNSGSGSTVARTKVGCYWDESPMLSDGFLHEFSENGRISSSENQENLNGEGRVQPIHAPTGLSHQLSLPSSLTELSVHEKLLQFQDNNVPLRSRAKRGCATHPRSIAERVRRTRISERMRKLQDLVPNMDTQTSIADMLDLAVDYIKQLQNQVETLSDRQAKCTCQNMLRP